MYGNSVIIKQYQFLLSRTHISFFKYIHTLLCLLGGMVIQMKYDLKIRFIYMTKLKSKYSKLNPKIHHFHHKCILELLLKMIYQIKCFIFDYLHQLYYHALILVQYFCGVDLKEYGKHLSNHKT